MPKGLTSAWSHPDHWGNWHGWTVLWELGAGELDENSQQVSMKLKNYPQNPQILARALPMKSMRCLMCSPYKTGQKASRRCTSSYFRWCAYSHNGACKPLQMGYVSLKEEFCKTLQRAATQLQDWEKAHNLEHYRTLSGGRMGGSQHLDWLCRIERRHNPKTYLLKGKKRSRAGTSIEKKPE